MFSYITMQNISPSHDLKGGEKKSSPKTNIEEFWRGKTTHQAFVKYIGNSSMNK